MAFPYGIRLHPPHLYHHRLQPGSNLCLEPICQTNKFLRPTRKLERTSAGNTSHRLRQPSGRLFSGTPVHACGLTLHRTVHASGGAPAAAAAVPATSVPVAVTTAVVPTARAVPTVATAIAIPTAVAIPTVTAPAATAPVATVPTATASAAAVPAATRSGRRLGPYYPAPATQQTSNLGTIRFETRGISERTTK